MLPLVSRTVSGGSSSTQVLNPMFVGPGFRHVTPGVCGWRTPFQLDDVPAPRRGTTPTRMGSIRRQPVTGVGERLGRSRHDDSHGRNSERRLL